MARRKARLHKNGRNVGATAFLMLENYVFDCPAYRTMKVGPRALLWELIRLHNGNNNGAIGLGTRSAADRLGVNKDTAAGYFRVLIERGFIAPAHASAFNMKDPQSRRATEWRLTWMPCNNQSPTKAFMDWVKKSTVSKTRTTRPKNPDSECGPAAQCPKNPDLSGSFRAAVGPKNPDTYTSSHRPGAFAGSADHSACAATWAAICNTFQAMEARA